MRHDPSSPCPRHRAGSSSVLLVLGVIATCCIGGMVLPAFHARALPAVVPETVQAPDAPAEDVVAALTTGGGQSLARARLRRLGPEAVTVLQQVQSQQPLLASPERWEDLYDQVCAQRDAQSSRLYWYTDLAQAQEAARATHRPILSLRLLGALTDEYSCANSRFLRALLYPDPHLSAYLRTHCILYWSSERTVPQVTIDLGDGRKLHATLGGNSIHYLLDDQLRVVDAFPGLYAPQAFLAGVSAAVDLQARIQAQPQQRSKLIAEYHLQALAARAQFVEKAGIALADVTFHAGASITGDFDRFSRIATGTILPQPQQEIDMLLLLAKPGNWSNLLGGGTRAGTTWSPGILPGLEADRHVPIGEAEAVTMSKMRVEMPMLRAAGVGDPPLRSLLPDGDLEILARGYLQRLDPLGCSVLDRQLIELRQLSHSPLPCALMHDVVALELAQDTVVDETVLHAAIHDHLLAHPELTWEDLNGWVYTALFLTPHSDSWLGLIPMRFDGIDHHLVP